MDNRGPRVQVKTQEATSYAQGQAVGKAQSQACPELTDSAQGLRESASGPTCCQLPSPRPNAAPKLDFCIIKAAHQHPATARWPLTIPPTQPCPPLRSLGF